MTADDPIPTKEELAARSATFHWPPTQAPKPPDSAAAFPSSSPSLREGAGGRTPVGSQASGPQHTSPHAQRPASPSSWSIVEQVWLGLVTPPLPQRMAQLGWVPDTPDLYCNRCAATVGPHESSAAGCPACTSRRLPWSRIIRLGEYEPPLSHFVHEVKFTRWRRLGRELGELLGESVVAALEAAGRDPSEVIVVPVPTTFRRRMARGIDHTRILAAAVARSLRAPLRQPLQRRHRPSQLDVPPSQRGANVSGAFRLSHPRRLARAIGAGPTATILVIDDVTTTGATLRATCHTVAEALRATPAAERPYIWAGVLAWTPQDGVGGRRGRQYPTDAEHMGGTGAVWT